MTTRVLALVLLFVIGSPRPHDATRLKMPSGTQGKMKSSSHDFWILQDAEALQDGFWSVTAVRLLYILDGIQTELSDTHKALTAEGFQQFFLANSCVVDLARSEVGIKVRGDELARIILKPDDDHAPISEDVAGAIVGNDDETLTLSIEIGEYITDGAWQLFRKFLEPAEEKLGEGNPLTSLLPLVGTSDSLIRAGEFLSETVAFGLAEALDSVGDLDILIESLRSREPEQYIERASSFLGLDSPGDSADGKPCSLDKPTMTKAKLQSASATAGVRLGFFTVFHILERIKLEEVGKTHRESVRTNQTRSWYAYMARKVGMNSQLYKGGLPTFAHRLSFADCRTGLTMQAAWPLSYGMIFQLLRDQVQHHIDPQRDTGKVGYSMGANILSSMTAQTLTHPFTVISTRANLGAEAPSGLYHHVHRGLMPSGVAAFHWGVAYGTTQALVMTALGPRLAEDERLASRVRIGIDALGASAGIFVSAPFSYAATQQYINPQEQVSLREIYTRVFAPALQNPKPFRELMTLLDMRNRLQWGVPRFTLIQLTMRAIKKLVDKEILE